MPEMMKEDAQPGAHHSKTSGAHTGHSGHAHSTGSGHAPAGAEAEVVHGAATHGEPSLTPKPHEAAQVMGHYAEVAGAGAQMGVQVGHPHQAAEDEGEEGAGSDSGGATEASEGKDKEEGSEDATVEKAALKGAEGAGGADQGAGAKSAQNEGENGGEQTVEQTVEQAHGEGGEAHDEHGSADADTDTNTEAAATGLEHGMEHGGASGGNRSFRAMTGGAGNAGDTPSFGDNTRGFSASQSQEKEPYFAETDGLYNKRTVVNNKIFRTGKGGKMTAADKKKNTKLLERPGIRFKGTDKFKLNGNRKTRYIITNGEKAEFADFISNKPEMAVQIAEARTLNVFEPATKDKDGKSVEGKLIRASVECVLVWVRGRGAAWLPIEDLELGDKKPKPGEPQKEGKNAKLLKAQIKRMSDKMAPEAAPSKDAKRYKFCKDVPVKRDEHLRLGPKQGAGNEADLLEHYLQRKVATDVGPGGFDKGAKSAFYNINLNLRSKNAAVVASDRARPGQYFFIPDGDQFKRKVGSYASGAATNKGTSDWVYGFMGKTDGDKWVPDTSRRGWVPRRCVERAP